MDKKIWFDVHATYQNCGIGIFTTREMEEAVKHSRVGGFIYDAHYRNSDRDLPRDLAGNGIRHLTNLNSEIDDAYVRRRVDLALDEKEWLGGVGHELVGYFGHEYGIFRDVRGKDFLVPLMKAYKEGGILNVLHPHTVLDNPERYGDDYRSIMKEAVKYADLILAMSPAAIDMLEDGNLYDASRGKVMLNWHGVDIFNNKWDRDDLKKKYIGDANCDLSLSYGWFSAGKLIDDGICAHVKLEEMTGDTNWKYLVVGYHKDPDHVAKCFDIARKLGTNPIMIGDGGDGDLERLATEDFSDNKVIFYNVFLSKMSLSMARGMADRVCILNESDAQVSSGTLVEALADSRITYSYRNPIAEGLAKEGAGFVVSRTPEGMAESMAHVKKNGDVEGLQRTARRVSARFSWDKTVPEFVDSVVAMID